MTNLNKTMDDFIENGTVKHIAVRVGRKDKVICDAFRNACETSLFDMASVTKIMATTSLALIALDKGLLQLNDTVDKFYPTDKSLIPLGTIPPIPNLRLQMPRILRALRR